MSEQKFKAGDRVVLDYADMADAAFGIAKGATGVVTEGKCSYGFVTVALDGRDGAWKMFPRQLELAPDTRDEAADPVTAAAKAYQRALCAYEDAMAEQARLADQAEAANEVRRQAGRAKVIAELELDQANHNAAGLKWDEGKALHLASLKS